MHSKDQLTDVQRTIAPGEHANGSVLEKISYPSPLSTKRHASIWRGGLLIAWEARSFCIKKEYPQDTLLISSVIYGTAKAFAFKPEEKTTYIYPAQRE